MSTATAGAAMGHFFDFVGALFAKLKNKPMIPFMNE
jgi:hypothetical protein